ncbi:MAG TPA: AraC family transcriptional regulator [Aliidongia sp.]|uniref:helix-turn-helix transcriptional regulator n=1 Tax=Aliidongia sp. TaxID=1914230 RepID=UPI002DDCF696|nr:AraC family transcriptional regulator [Aliidongia sp.]HEV2677034.1 AraC family transcriptional regulator [Aliidongia sp.]
MDASALLGGFSAKLRHYSGGSFAVPAQAEHLLSLHVGAPVRADCRCDGLRQRRLQVAGDIDIVPAGHDGVWTDEGPATLLHMSMAPAFLRRAASELDLDPDRIQLRPQLQLRDPLIAHVGWAMKASLEVGHPGGRLFTDSLGLGLAAHLLGRYEPARALRQELSKRQLRRVLDHVDAHLDQDLSLAVLAGEAGLSASHFRVLFKQTVGQSAHHYVNRRRVERAQALLLSGAMGIAEVALETGFAHQSHLARAMRRTLGVTPGQIVRSRR